ncbi:hypothetical protein CAEBREN_15568 [Caenorhabditis brenneri]|uniref:RING-type domain-containing protein n=1 Tax=Caenorhabditis brenneri TaxID=135651 RepID=G0MUR7_CAEBE|nr:hypothetical protein CAEBREN_15568 [Caenorhabditis brenneri]
MAGRRQARKREQVIPASELAWGMGESDRYGGRQLSEVQLREQKYRLVQREVKEVVHANIELRMAEEYKSIVKNVKMEEQSEQLPIDHPDTQYRGRTLPPNAVILTEQYSPRYPQHTSEEKFEEIQKRLKETVGGFGNCGWMKKAVLYPLGPRDIRKMQKFENSHHRHHLPQYKLLVDNAMSTAYLAMESGHSKEATVHNIEQFLGSSGRDEIIISEPNSGFGIRLAKGEDPQVMRSRDSPIALIFDTPYTRYVKEVEAESEYQRRLIPVEPAQYFYEDMFRCRISSTRLLNDPEKKSIEDSLSRNDIRSRAVRLIEFETVEQRLRAMGHRGVEALDVYYSDTQFGYKQVHETLHLYVKYQMKPKEREHVAVTLECHLDKNNACSVFRSHCLQVSFLDVDGKTMNEEAKYNKDCKTLILQNFPAHMFRHEVREWFVRRICDLNGIRTERIEKFVEPIHGATQSFLDAKRVNAAGIINMELQKLADPVLRGADLAWTVTRKNEGPIKEEEMITVQFKSVITGARLIRRVLLECQRGCVFQIDKEDYQGPELRPCYRKTFVISRRIRAALSETIRTFDHSARKSFTALTAVVDENMLYHDSVHYRLRVHEEWKSGSDAGIIGIMGWPVDVVRNYTEKLRKLVEPQIVGECPELLEGAGELYAKSLEKKYPGALVIEVDKFNDHVKVIGDAADSAVKDLKAYLDNSGKIGMRTWIPIGFPFVNERVAKAMSGRIVEDLKTVMGINHLFFDRRGKCLEFEGSVAQYEKLVGMMEELSMDCFKKEIRGRAETGVPAEGCHICFCEMQRNYFRFQCGHSMCRDCANNKIKSIDAGGIQIRCNYPGCEKPVEPSEILAIILGGPNRMKDLDTANMHRLVTQLKQAIFNNNQDYQPCNSTDCPGLIHKSRGDPLRYKTCTSCPRQYCRMCLLEPHHGHTCEAYARLRIDDESVRAYMESRGPGNVKKCPKCATPVDKIDGCHHMECRCGIHFCWLCLAMSETSQQMYAHLSEVHGGHGGPNLRPEQLAEEEGGVAMQQQILQNVPPV